MSWAHIRMKTYDAEWETVSEDTAIAVHRIAYIEECPLATRINMNNGDVLRVKASADQVVSACEEAMQGALTRAAIAGAVAAMETAKAKLAEEEKEEE